MWLFFSGTALPQIIGRTCLEAALHVVLLYRPLHVFLLIFPRNTRVNKSKPLCCNCAKSQIGVFLSTLQWTVCGLSDQIDFGVLKLKSWNVVCRQKATEKIKISKSKLLFSVVIAALVVLFCFFKTSFRKG